jgi:hypothetical protein
LRELTAVGDPRQVVSDPEARISAARVEEYSLAPLGEARRGGIVVDEWLRHSRERSLIRHPPTAGGLDETGDYYDETRWVGSAMPHDRYGDGSAS